MSYPVWPETLPQVPLRDGFAGSGTAPVRRQEMESGPDRVTRVATESVRTNSVSIYVATQAQLATFWTFWDVEANAGADWVVIPMHTANTVAPHLARIVGYPRHRRMGIGWRISFELETQQQIIDWSTQ